MGYRQGQTPPEDVAVRREVTPDLADAAGAAGAIQAALDAVGQLPVGPDGFRGAVLLGAGRYEVDRPLRMTRSGVVLRGEGRGEDGTVLIATRRDQHTLIEVSGEGARQSPDGAAVALDDAPMGADVVRAPGLTGIAEGDRVAVRMTPNQAWIERLGMDRLRQRHDRARDWRPDQYQLVYERTALRVQGDLVQLDVPLPVAIRADDGGAVLEPVSFPGRLTNVGVEDLRLVSEYDPAVTREAPMDHGPVPSDERHGWTAVQLDAVEDAWVRRVTALHFGGLNFRTGPLARRVSFLDCEALDPVSRIVGGRRYGFSIGGELTLVQRCRTRNQRHDYAMNYKAPGPNAFVDCVGERSWNFSEPHHRWATGVLFDNVVVDGPMAGLVVADRGTSGTGHGWAGANVIFWNTDAPLYVLMAAPGTHTLLAGRRGEIDPATDQYERRIAWFADVNGRPPLTEQAPGVLGDGSATLVSPGEPVQPASLYAAQRAAATGDAQAAATLRRWTDRLLREAD